MNSGHPQTLGKLTWNVPSLSDQQRFPPEIVFRAGMRHHHIANTAYPIHHSTTMRPYRVPPSEVQATARAGWQQIDILGLYVHVPFCARRCRYCEYTVVDQNGSQAQEEYVAALQRELRLWRSQIDTSRKTLIGFDIGGGTPSFLPVDHIRTIVDTAMSSFQIRPGMTISIETTPAIAAAEPDKIRAYKAMGIDRISMGVQTTHLQLAQSLGREYGGPVILRQAVRAIRQAGFDRFNIDLMYGFVDQSPERWRTTVKKTIELAPEYITLYQMRYKGTRMQQDAAHITRERVYNLGRIAKEELLAAGYAGLPGKNTFSRIAGDVGTSDYLTERVIKGTPYLGVGVGAQSLSQCTLAYNRGAASKTLPPYLEAVSDGLLPIQDLYHLPIDVAMAKMIAVSFYFGQIHLAHLRDKFGIHLHEHFAPEVAYVHDQGLMHQVGPYLRLTERGVANCNGVIALFYSSAVKDYLINLGTSLAAGGRKAA